MANTVSALLSVETLKAQIVPPIPADDDSQDGQLTNAIRNAVLFIQTKIADPIIDEIRALRWDNPVDGQPFRFHQRFVTTASDARYHLPTQNPAEAPNGLIRGGTLRLERLHNGDNEIWPPAPGYDWPQRAPGTPITFDVLVGITTNSTEGAVVQQAAILAARAFYDGDTDFRETNTIDAVLAQVSGAVALNA